MPLQTVQSGGCTLRNSILTGAIVVLSLGVCRGSDAETNSVSSTATQRWQNAREGSSNAWENVKGRSVEAWGKVEEGSSNAWHTVQHGTTQAWENVRGHFDASSPKTN